MKDKNLVLMKTLDTKFKQGTSPPDIPPLDPRLLTTLCLTL